MARQLLTFAHVVGFELRYALRRPSRGPQIAYRDGPTINAMPGMTLLEASRAALVNDNDVQHALFKNVILRDGRDRRA